ncbi:MAG: HIT family protein [bacterium]|nr:HIT family protein [bacterium]
MCVFCKIIAGEIPAYKVYEDERVLAFLDITPVHVGHTLVIPKKHVANLEAIESDDLTALILAVKKIGKKIKENLAYDGYNVLENNDPVAGQVISHIHFHLIPRKAGDGLNRWPDNKYAEGEEEDTMNKLKS